MTDAQRLEKLQQAEALIREVEFSYPTNDETRRSLYKVVVDNFSWTGTVGQLMMRLKENLKRGS